MALFLERIVIDWCCMCMDGYISLGANCNHLCCMCSRESFDDLLSDIASALWNDFFRLVGFLWVMFEVLRSFLFLRRLGSSPQIAAGWKMVPICLIWCMWNERNDTTFEGNEQTMEELQNFFIHTIPLDRFYRF